MGIESGIMRKGLDLLKSTLIKMNILDMGLILCEEIITRSKIILNRVTFLIRVMP